jgi:hypothetical protein
VFMIVRLMAAALVGFIAACTQCDPTVVTPVGEGEGEVAEGEGEVGEGEGDGGEGEGDGGEGEGEGEGEVPLTCVFPPLQEFNDFECEGDEDFCDPVATDRVGPAADLMATWSRIEGDQVIIEARFRMMPFRTERTEVGLCLGSGFGFEDFSYRFGDWGPYSSTFECSDGWLFIGSTPPHVFPLSDGMPHGAVTDQSFSTLPIEHPYRGCDAFVGRFSPYIKYKFNLSGPAYEYFLLTYRRIADNQMFDGSVEGNDVYFLNVSGGRPDEEVEYQSICEMTCEGAGGVLQ